MKKATIGDRLREERERLGLNQKKMGLIGGVSYKTQGLYENNKRYPDADYLASISHDADILYILTGERKTIDDRFQDEMKFVPVYDVSASAGPGAFNTTERALGEKGFQRGWLEKRGLFNKRLCNIRVVGNSMEPYLWDGDSILVNMEVPEKPVSGLPYVIRIDEDLVVKYLQRLPNGHLLLSSANKDYPPFEVNPENDDVQIIGFVANSSHDWMQFNDG